VVGELSYGKRMRELVGWIACILVLVSSVPATGAFAADAGERRQGVESQTPRLTPLLARGGADVVPFTGSDGRVHLLWEVPLQNATTLALTVTAVDVLGDGVTIRSLSEAEIASSIEVVGTRSASAEIGPGQAAFLFLTLAFDDAEQLPQRLDHRLTVAADRLPHRMTTSGGTVRVARDAVVPLLGPPLEAATGYLAADGCCTSVRHIRAGLPIDNREWFAQRFAIDWTQLNEAGAFVAGDPSVPRNYAIYGRRVLAAADGRVVSVQDGLEDQVPGQLPGTSLPLDQVDGNAVVIDIGDGLFTLHAHLQKGSIRVAPGDTVRRGDTIALVGNSGNSSSPHLHFHVMDGPLPLGSNGRPYVIDSFRVVGRAVSTAEVDRVETSEEPVPASPVDGDPGRAKQLPLDLSIVAFD